jgi:hypothetical protein
MPHVSAPSDCNNFATENNPVNVDDGLNKAAMIFA